MCKSDRSSRAPKARDDCSGPPTADGSRFFAGGKLKKVEAAGGPPQNVCETPDLLGGTWNADGVIVFASSKGLQRVPAAGGRPSAIEVAGDSQQQRPREPYFLPDGNHYLYLAGAAASDAAIYAGSLDSTDSTRLVAAQSNAVYADPGYLLYHREGTLYAQTFDASDLELSGEAIRLADGIPYAEAGAAAFAASHTGVLIYRNDPQRQAAAAGAAAISTVGCHRRSAAALGRPYRHQRTGGGAGWMGGRRPFARRQAGGGASPRSRWRGYLDLRGRKHDAFAIHVRRRAGQLLAHLVSRRYAHRLCFAAERQVGAVHQARGQHTRRRIC